MADSEGCGGREVLRIRVAYEDSPYVLECSSWVARQAHMVFKLTCVEADSNECGSIVRAEMKAPSRDVDKTTTETCNLQLSPSSKRHHVIVFVHALAAAASQAVFPFKYECSRLVALLRCTDTARLAYAPHGLSMQEVSSIVAANAGLPIVPMLACKVFITEFLTSTWSLSVVLECACEGNTPQSIAVSVQQKDLVIVRMEFRASERFTWYRPSSLIVTNGPGATPARLRKAMSFLLRDKHVKAFPLGAPLKQLAHHHLTGSVECCI